MYYYFSLAIIIIIHVYSSKLLNMITSAQAITISYYSSLLWCTGCKYNYKVSQIIQNLQGVEGGKCLLVILEECLLTILQYDVVGLSCMYQLVFYFCFCFSPYWDLFMWQCIQYRPAFYREAIKLENNYYSDLYRRYHHTRRYDIDCGL